MDAGLSEITQYMFVLENQILRTLGESYVLATLCFVVVALGSVSRLCFSKPGPNERR